MLNRRQGTCTLNLGLLPQGAPCVNQLLAHMMLFEHDEFDAEVVCRLGT